MMMYTLNMKQLCELIKFLRKSTQSVYNKPIMPEVSTDN